jgi:hypothetical protein
MLIDIGIHILEANGAEEKTVPRGMYETYDATAYDDLTNGHGKGAGFTV